jgi:Mg-chelatase subunit ChlD
MKKNKKSGISAIIGVVLMLIILLTLTGFAYMYILGIFSSKIAKSFFVNPGTSSNQILVTNTGSVPIDEITAYDNSYQTIPSYIDCTNDVSNIIFSDNFDDNNANGWNVLSGNWHAFSQSYESDSTMSINAESNVNVNFTYATIQFDFRIGNRRNVDVMLIIDRSGSMQGQKLSAAKTAAKTFVDHLNPNNDKSGLVSYSNTVAADQLLTNNQNDVKNKIDSLVANGNTDTGDAIYNATNQLVQNGRSDSIHVEILLTDGLANLPTNVGVATQYAENAARGAASHNIYIYTIGLGSDVNSTFLNNVATITGGKYYFAPNTDMLNQIYGQIAGELLTGGSAGIILKQNGNVVAKVTATEGQNIVNITDKNDNTVGSGNFRIQNNTLYTAKVIASGKNIFVNINNSDVAYGQISSVNQKNSVSLFSTNNIVLFDNVKVSDDTIGTGRTCQDILFNYTQKGKYTARICTSTMCNLIIITNS